jgi:hypothetical protein
MAATGRIMMARKAVTARPRGFTSGWIVSPRTAHNITADRYQGMMPLLLRGRNLRIANKLRVHFAGRCAGNHIDPDGFNYIWFLSL